MIPGFEAIVEERIKKAQKEGAFNNLEGAHKPLKFEDEHVPDDLRLAHKILKNAGFLPPEVELKKKISSTEQLLAGIEADSPERQQLQKRLNYLFTKLDTLRGQRSCLLPVPEEYRNTMIKKMS